MLSAVGAVAMEDQRERMPVLVASLARQGTTRTYARALPHTVRVSARDLGQGVVEEAAARRRGVDERRRRASGGLPEGSIAPPPLAEDEVAAGGPLLPTPPARQRRSRARPGGDDVVAVATGGETVIDASVYTRDSQRNAERKTSRDARAPGSIAAPILVLARVLLRVDQAPANGLRATVEAGVSSVMVPS